MAFCRKCGKEKEEEGTVCSECNSLDFEPGGATEFKEQGKNFLASVFDFNMKEMITPKVIKVIFFLGVVGIGFAVLAGIVSSFSAATHPLGSWGWFFATLIFAPLGGIIAVILFRIYMEIILLLFHMYDEIKAIRRSR